MADFKLNIADPKAKKIYLREVKDDQAKPLIGVKIGDTVKGEVLDLTGYEFLVTGGSDKCGFPMRSGINSPRKRILGHKGVGLRKRLLKGIKIKKTVCGAKINADIRQINLKITKQGAKPITEVAEKPEVLGSKASGTADAVSGTTQGGKKEGGEEAPKENPVIIFNIAVNPSAELVSNK